MIGEIQRQAAFAQISVLRQKLYLDPDSGEIMKTAFDAHRDADSDYVAYGTIIGDTILGFYSVSDLAQHLSTDGGFTPAQAEGLAADLADFLAPLIDDPAPSLQPVPTPAGVPEIVEAEPAAAEQTAIPAVTPLRTMATDMQKVHGYGALYGTTDDGEAVHSSSQDTTLGKNQLATTPTYSEETPSEAESGTTETGQ